MLYKVLAAAALLATTNAGGGGANSVDPRTMWFRWAIPRAGGYNADDTEQDHKTYENKVDGTADGRNIRTCGVNVAPNSITQCYYTDCFESLHKFPTRRRMGGGEIHGAVAKGPSGGNDGCGKQGGRRRMGGGPALAIQCMSNTCKADTDTMQFRYWRKGAAAYKGLEKTTGTNTITDTYGLCPGGNNPAITSGVDKGAISEESWIWYGSQQAKGGACIYKNPPATCQCKTVVCRVSTDATKNLDTAAWDAADTTRQDGDECNFIVRIEDVWSAPGVSKKMMWWIFSISSFISLVLTLYYYVTYGDELVKEGEGSEGSGN